MYLLCLCIVCHLLSIMTSSSFSFLFCSSWNAMYAMQRYVNIQIQRNGSLLCTNFFPAKKSRLLFFFPSKSSSEILCTCEKIRVPFDLKRIVNWRNLNINIPLIFHQTFTWRQVAWIWLDLIRTEAQELELNKFFEWLQAFGFQRSRQ